MAGTTILSGSLTTSDAFRRLPRRLITMDAVLDAVSVKRRAMLLAYSLYSLLMDCDRYKTKFLLPLPLHDPEGLGHRYEGVGDFAISDEDGKLYECIEIASSASISPSSVAEAVEKVQTYSPRRFCLLTLGEIDPLDKASLQETSASLSRRYGCEIVVDSLMETISSGLRFLAEPSDLLAAYAQALQEDQIYPDCPV